MRRGRAIQAALTLLTLLAVAAGQTGIRGGAGLSGGAGIKTESASGETVARGTNASASATTWSHTVSGTHALLLAYILTDGTVTGVTYNSVAMTAVGTGQGNGGNAFVLYTYCLPIASGDGVSHAFNVSVSGQSQIHDMSVFYTGAHQSCAALPNNSNSANGSATYTLGTLTVGGNSWLAGASYNQAGSNLTAAAGNYQVRQGAFAGWQMWDSNAALSAGSQSLQATGTYTAGSTVVEVVPGP